MENRCKMCILRNAVELCDEYALWASAAILRKKFNTQKRKFLTLCTMLSNEPDEIIELTEVALNELTFGPPLPPFSSYKEDAQWWVERASVAELEAYAVKSFLALSKPRQRDFAIYVVRKSNDG